MKRNKLYTSLGFLLIAGYSWLLWNLRFSNLQENADSHTICLFRRFTGIPCPSCGSTHALMALSQLHFAAAIHYNPIGFIIGIAMLVVPLWIISDLLMKKESFYIFYRRLEQLLRKRWVAIPIILLIACNWIWNIYKFKY